MRCVSVIECYSYFSASALDGIEDFPAPRRIDGHGLLRYNVAAEFKRADNVLVVCAVNSCDDDFVGLRLMDHAVKVLCYECRHLDVSEGLKLGVCIVEPCLVRVA